MDAGMLKEMGVDSVGHRLYMLKILRQAKREYNNKVRNTVVWRENAIRRGQGFCDYLGNCGCCDSCLLGMGCLLPTAEYTLTGSRLSIKDMLPMPCCMRPFFICLKRERKTNHIDLSAIKDMDTETNPQCCECCGCNSQKVQVTVNASSELKTERGAISASQVTLVVKDAEDVCRKLRNAVEENRNILHMERN